MLVRLADANLINLHPRQPKKLGEKPVIHESAVVRNCRIGPWTEIYANCHLEESSFGDYSYAAGDVNIIYSEIGKFCSIAPYVRINPGNHPMHRVTQHHCTYRRVQFGFDTGDDEEFFQWRRDHKCIIGHDVWIGHGAIIMPGITVGTGAVVGAGAIVTKNVAPYEMVAGVPAKPIGKRFSEDVVAKLLKIAWWDWPRNRLEERFGDLRDVEFFVERYFKG
ncbi:MAG: DapH/DapD/GlmU-related protein [Negativicutes bacterium]|nr:DapH/DapD/GlmU-related protein [Negativicutes bacterium]